MSERIRHDREPVKEKRLPDAVVGNMLAALGNYEPKIILLLSMKPGERYSQLALHNASQHARGKLSSGRGSKNLELQFCERSLSPIGLVTKEEFIDDGRVIRVEFTKTSFGSTAGDALGSALLAVSERHPDYALMDFFGSTNTTSRKSTEVTMPDGTTAEHKNRAPFTRFQVLQALAAEDPPKTMTGVAKTTGLAVTAVSHHMRALQERGVVSLTTRELDKSYAVFELSESAPDTSPTPYRREVSLTQKVYNLTGVCEGEITSDAIHALLVASEPENAILQKDEGRSRVSRILSHLSREGYLRYKEFSGEVQSHIALTENQKTAIKDVVDTVNQFASGDEQVWAAARAKGKEIMADPDRVTKLYEKAKTKSGVNHRRSSEEMHARIIQIVNEHPSGISSTGITAALKEQGISLNWATVANIITAVRKKEGITVLKQGRRYMYGPVNKAEVDAKSDARSHDRDVTSGLKIDSPRTTASVEANDRDTEGTIFTKYLGIQPQAKEHEIFSRYGIEDTPQEQKYTKEIHEIDE